MIKKIFLIFIFILPTFCFADETKNNLSDSDSLPSPTENFEAYEKARIELFQKQNTPSYGFHLFFSPRAFRQTDFRYPKPDSMPQGQSPSQIIPSFYGLHINAEKNLTRSLGVISLGIQGGVYFSKAETGYTGLQLGLPSLGPTLSFQLLLSERQFLVPIVRAQAEAIYLAYYYEGSRAGTVSYLMRGEAGAALNFAIFDSSLNSDLNSSFSIKKTMLAGFYSIAQDKQKKVIDLSERTWKIAFMFEL